ncbi:hypothetical protein VB757_10595 [Synechococcus sp. BA-132 BA5]|nr:hypothetical protein [Synechococcus sp. BA-132 BA5]
MGRPKTGTSAIQAFLRLNKNLLEENDISYIGNLAPLAMPFSDYARKIQAAPPEQYQASIIEMRNAIAARMQSNLIYSNESHYWSRKVLKAYKAAVGTLPLTVVLYLRRQDEDLQAQYMQNVVDRDARESRSIRDINKHTLNLLQLLSDYDEVFGRYNLVPRIYDKHGFYNGNIFEDFFLATGLQFPESAQYPGKSTSNISRGRLYIEILRLANQRRKPNTHADNMSRIDEYLGNNAFKSDGSDYSFLSRSEENAIMEEYAATNSEVARKYFGLDDGILFRDRSLAENEKEMNCSDDATMQADANRIYALIFPD